MRSGFGAAGDIGAAAMVLDSKGGRRGVERFTASAFGQSDMQIAIAGAYLAVLEMVVRSG